MSLLVINPFRTILIRNVVSISEFLSQHVYINALAVFWSKLAFLKIPKKLLAENVYKVYFWNSPFNQLLPAFIHNFRRFWTALWYVILIITATIGLDWRFIFKFVLLLFFIVADFVNNLDCFWVEITADSHSVLDIGNTRDECCFLCLIC